MEVVSAHFLLFLRGVLRYFGHGSIEAGFFLRVVHLDHIRQRFLDVLFIFVSDFDLLLARFMFPGGRRACLSQTGLGGVFEGSCGGVELFGGLGARGYARCVFGVTICESECCGWKDEYFEVLRVLTF